LTEYSDLANKLRQRNAKSVALQFPEGLKRRAREIALFLKDEGFFVIVDADPCYGACDLASDALPLVDALIHFGHTAVDDPGPKVIFEPFSVDFDLAVLEKAAPLLRQRTIGLVTTVQHVHLLSAIVGRLAEIASLRRHEQGPVGAGRGRSLDVPSNPRGFPPSTRSFLSGRGFSIHSASASRPGRG